MPSKRIEGGVEAEACTWALNEYGIESRKLGTEGWPDRILFLPGGRPWLVEFKKPKVAHRFQPLQPFVHSRLRFRGYDVSVIDDLVQFKAEFRKRIKKALYGCKTPPTAAES